MERPNIASQIDFPTICQELGVDTRRMTALGSIVRPIVTAVMSPGTAEDVAIVDMVQRHIFPSLDTPDEMTISVHSTSDEDVQPRGFQTVAGSLTRLMTGARLLRSQYDLDSNTPLDITCLAVEYGMFRVGQPGAAHPYYSTDPRMLRIDYDDANMDTAYDYNEEVDYAERTVVAISMPDHPVVVTVSPTNEAALIPKEAIHAAYNASGGLAINSAVSKLGLHRRDPLENLGYAKVASPDTRRDQLVRGVLRGYLMLIDADDS